MVVGLWRVFYKVTHIPGFAHIKTSVGLCPANYANFSLEEVRRELICVYWMDETNEAEVRMELSCAAYDIVDMPSQSLKPSTHYEVYTPSDGGIYYSHNDYVIKAEICEIKG